MKVYLFLASFILATISGKAQDVIGKDTADLIPGSTFVKVEKESEFPGGINAWGLYLQQNLNYPKKAVKKNVQGTVIVQFIVEKDGTLSEIQAVSGPELLRAAAVSALKNSPNWIPALYNGRNVKSYKKQPIVFRLQ